MSTNNLLSAIRGLEDAVYYRDSRGRYASLPDNNSMRIDLLSNRVNSLAKLIEESTGGNIPTHIKAIVKYLNGSITGDDFVQTVGSNIIKPKEGDTKDYTTVQKVLQELYDGKTGGDTYITLDEEHDPYVKCIIKDTEPTNYREDLKHYPDVFKYIYEELNYLFNYLFEMENEFDVYEGMEV